MKEKPKILIVDDDDLVREVVAMTLHCHGFEAVAVGDGPSALKATEQTRFSAVICDNLMPGMSGAEVVSRLRTGEKTAQLPIILSSGRPDSIHSSQPNSRIFLLPKPFLPAELIATVTAAVTVV